MKYGLSENDIELIKKVFSRFGQAEEVLIFGSRAKGNFQKSSDIDLAVKGEEVDDKTVRHIRGILEDEIPLPYKFDVVNYVTISNPDFIDHIDRVGILFYKKENKPSQNNSSFNSAFETVKKLADDFKANEKHFLSPDFSEAQARKDFIDKFFIALGWDVNHDEQKNPYEQEVKVERTERNQKRSDYAFFIAPNFKDPKFFAEAKKPAKALKNAQDYFQTIRYGWNAATPVAVLTDFEEFHILDCRFRPDINTVLSGLHKRYHYSDYSNKEKFAEIYYLFSRDAVANNSIEKYTDALPKPKGKAIQKALFKGGYQPIDEEFLEYIDGMRETLAKAFKKNNQHLTSEELTEDTQRTIDRLVFIRFLEDKLIEQENYVSEFGAPLCESGLVKRTDGGNAWADFIGTCKKLDAKYNGIVFKKHFIDEHTFKGADANEFRDICNEICHLHSPYDFNAIPIHILGSIYERFLGKIVDASEKRVKIKEKPEVRKAGGVYYTPKYIVDYIVQNTVGKLIDGKTPEQISRMRFADIACGSGSFLIGVFETLLDYHNKYYAQHPDKAKKDGCLFKDGLWVLSIKQKQNILRNNIYGVDIDNQAVEVTQLSLALKMLEDETTATANEMQVLFHEKILPDMSKNIVCGNSLIGSDILNQNLFAGEEERKLNPMDFEGVFPDIMRQGGFDAIVGNPPYVNLVALPDMQRKYFQKKFTTCKNKSDLYSFFIEKVITLVNKKNYKFGYIVPHTWLATDSFELLRKLLLNERAIEQIADMGFKVFKKVIVSTVILIGANENKKIRILNKDFSRRYEVDFKDLEKNNYQIELDWSKDKNFIYERLKKETVPLETIIKFSRGVKTSDDERFILGMKKNKDCKKIFRGKNIKAYQLNWNNEWIWYRPDLMREKVGSLPHNKEFFEVPEKIITQRVNSSMQLLVAYDNEGNYFLDTTNVSRYDTWDKKHSFKFLCGVLNSRLINFWYCNKYKMPTIGGYELHTIPIKPINFQNKTKKSQHDKMVQLVEHILQAKKQLHTATTDKDKTYYTRRCTELDTAIDNLVYELYGLTEEERKIVEGKQG